MTAQVPDTILYNNEKYDLVGLKGGNLAIPEQFGMETEMENTACWRGFYATYKFLEGSLYLKDMTINSKNGQYVPIAGVKAENGVYQQINMRVFFTGKMRIAKDFIQGLYVRMGFQSPTAYKAVVDISLKQGRIVEIKDRSKDAEEKRGSFKKEYDTTRWSLDPEAVINSIDDAFSLNIDGQGLSGDGVINLGREDKILKRSLAMLRDFKEQIVEMLSAENFASQESIVQEFDFEIKRIEDSIKSDETKKRVLQFLLMAYRKISIDCFDPDDEDPDEENFPGEE